MQRFSDIRDAFAKETLAVSSSVVTLTAATYSPGGGLRSAQYAFITVETNPIRWWCTGDNPTTTQGHLAAVGDIILLEGVNNVRNFKAIRSTADATIQASYSR